MLDKYDLFYLNDDEGVVFLQEKHGCSWFHLIHDTEKGVYLYYLGKEEGIPDGKLTPLPEEDLELYRDYQNIGLKEDIYIHTDFVTPKVDDLIPQPPKKRKKPAPKPDPSLPPPLPLTIPEDQQQAPLLV